jgi:FtsH-binding integral membrane protein
VSSVICADPNIRLLVGPERAGIGYGIAGSLCGVIAVAAPMAGGVFMDMDDPNKPLESGVNVAWFFAGTMVLSTLVWLVVSTHTNYTHTTALSTTRSALGGTCCAARTHARLLGLGWQTLGMCPGLV